MRATLELCVHVGARPSKNYERRHNGGHQHTRTVTLFLDLIPFMRYTYARAYVHEYMYAIRHGVHSSSMLAGALCNMWLGVLLRVCYCGGAS